MASHGVVTSSMSSAAGKGFATDLGDEGGFAPDIDHAEDVLALIVGAVGDAGYAASRVGVAIALDPATSEFYHDGAYQSPGRHCPRTT